MNRDNQISAMDLIQIAFIILKLCGVIKWSWWWVLAPMWGTGMLVIIAIAIKVIRTHAKKVRMNAMKEATDHERS